MNGTKNTGVINKQVKAITAAFIPTKRVMQLLCEQFLKTYIIDNSFWFEIIISLNSCKKYTRYIFCTDRLLKELNSIKKSLNLRIIKAESYVPYLFHKCSMWYRCETLVKLFFLFFGNRKNNAVPSIKKIWFAWGGIN